MAIDDHCDSEFCRVALNHIVPALGCITAFLIFISPFRVVREADRLGKLGNLNPFPYPMIVSNCLVWIFYGLLETNAYVVGPNVPGLLLGVYYTMMASRVTNRSTRSTLTVLTLSGILFVVAGAIVSFIILKDNHDIGRKVMGSFCGVVFIAMYTAPLSELVRVVKERNSVHFYWPLSVTCLLNAAFWAIYGFVIVDFFIAVPNAIGAVVATIQIVCVAIFPKKEPASQKSYDDDFAQ